LFPRSKSGICNECLELERTYLPTPDQIRAECEQIRSEWDAERWREARGTPAWNVPRVRFAPEEQAGNQDCD